MALIRLKLVQKRLTYKQAKDLTITNTTNKQANGAAPASFLKDNATGDIYAVGTDGKNYKATIDKTSGDITAIAAAETTGLTDTSATTTVKEEVAASGPDAANLHSYDNGKSYVIQEGTGANAKYFKASVDATGKVTKGAEQSTEPKLPTRWRPWTKRCLRLTPAFFPGCGTEPFRFCYQQPEQHR